MPDPAAPETEPESLRLPDVHALLHTVLESGVVATVVIGADGRIAYANPAFAEALGYDQREAAGLLLRDIVHPESLGDAMKSAEDLFAGVKRVCKAERRLIRKDGTPVWMLAGASLLRNERTGEPVGLIAQLTDIDKQKEAEAEIASVERRWNLALEGAGQGVWDHNIRAGTMFYSRMWRIMRGVDPDESVDGAMDKWLARVHPEDRDRIRQIVIGQDAGHIPFNAFEYRERHRDGHYIWILSRGRPVEWFPDGKPARIVGTDTDISSLKQVEAELAEEKERLNVTLQSIGDGVISTDAAGRVTFMNPLAERMTGWPSGDAVGRKVQDVFNIVSDTTGEAAVNPVAECLMRREPYYLEDDVMLVSRAGEQRYIRDSAAPVRTPDGRIIGAVLVFQDVTSSRTLQKQLAHSAMHDSLTGLPNRAAFEAAMQSAIAQARDERREHALCFVDLDRFKRVNDSAGHAAGDALLKVIAKVIRGACRAHDFTARIGGDEFALILPDCPVHSARRVAAQVVDSIAAVRFGWEGRVYEIGASVGIAQITGNGPGMAELVRQADSACYAAKAAGRNSVAVHGGEPAEPAFRQSA